MRKLGLFLSLLLFFNCFAADRNASLSNSLKEYTLGVLLSQKGDCEKAIPHFEKALEYNKNIHIYFELADCYKSLSELEKTIEYLELATKNFPDNPEGYLRLGDYYSELVQTLKSPEIVKKALENYRKAFELSGDYEILYNVIESEFLLQDYDAVIKDYESLPDAFKTDYYTLFYASVAYNSKKKSFELFQTLRRLIRIRIDNPRILNELIGISFSNHFYLFAFRFSLNLKLIYREYNDWDRLFLSGLLAGKYKEVVDIYNKNLKDSPTPVSVYCVATAYSYLHDYKKSKKFYEMILKGDDLTLSGDLNRDVYLDYIKVLLALGDYKGAYKETLNYEKVYGLSPDNILKLRFESLILAKNYKEAKKVIYIFKITSSNKKVIDGIEKMFKKNPECLGYDYLASLYYSLRDFKKSAPYFKKCLNCTNDWLAYGTNLALVYHNLGDVENAKKLYEKLYEKYPENPVVLNNYAYFLLEFNLDLKKAFELAKKAVDKKPETDSYRDTLGLAYLKMGNLEKAEENLMYAYKHMPANPDVCLHLGDFYFAKGDKDKAKEFWQDAIDFGIQDVEKVKDRLNRLNSL